MHVGTESSSGQGEGRTDRNVYRNELRLAISPSRWARIDWGVEHTSRNTRCAPTSCST